ncbi:MAG: primosomal protein N' [Bacteroidota bacterium]|nr:primosomal protein N' [Bacteroidota bacterium]
MTDELIPTETLFVDVVLPFYLPGFFTYRVPQIFEAEVGVGKRVVVQFGKSKVYAGIIVEVHHRVPTLYQAKYIQAVVDDQPLVSDIQLAFWKWMASYYMCTTGEVMNAALPAGLKLESETRIILRGDTPIDYEQLSDKEYFIIEALEVQKELSIKQIANILDVKNVYAVIKSLFQRELIWVKEEIIKTYKPKVVEYIKLSQAYDSDEALQTLFAQLEKRAAKQVDALMQFLHLRQTSSTIQRIDLAKALGNSTTIKALIDKGIFETYIIQSDNVENKDALEISNFELNEGQEQAYKLICKQLYTENKEVSLIHGVTGSGKTHIYVKLIEQALKEGKQVLYMLPEIALTGQMIERLKKYFGNRIMVSHSKFSENERVAIWNKLATKKVDIILGPRSSLFLPYHNLGLIIVDEEHEPSYKQQEPAPRYHGRDSAIVLAKMHGAKVVLGSATPAIETYYNTTIGKYGLVEMQTRYGGVAMPDMILADVAEAKKYLHLKKHFTPELLEAIEYTLDKHKQTIIFQNRRGYVPVHECTNCGWVAKCIHCDVALTYHKYSDLLKCHYCGYSEKVVMICKACGSKELTHKGYGTEMIEDDLKELLPNARIARMDLETTRSKTGHQNIIKDLEEMRTDILVGTQMVSKGLDFENVILVGIMNADQMLHFPDFRANERTFQMLVQVSGRSGRRQEKGKVIIQTSAKEHPVLGLVLNNDYIGLYHSEIAQREKHIFPPFCRMIKLTLRHKNYTTAELAAYALGLLLKQKLGSRVMGPEKPYQSKLKDHYIWHLLIKVEIGSNISMNKVKTYINECREVVSAKFKSTYIIPDVDPY